MWTTRTQWNDGTRPTVLMWVDEPSARAYEARMKSFGHHVECWKLP